MHMLTNLILALTPEDGSAIDDKAMLAQLRDYLPDLSEKAYAEAKGALVEDGVLGGGKGRGGLMYHTYVVTLKLASPAQTEP